MFPVWWNKTKRCVATHLFKNVLHQNEPFRSLFQFKSHPFKYNENARKLRF